MILLIDAGNTRIKWCVADESAPRGDWLAAGALAHDETAALKTVRARFPALSRALGTNVAGPRIAAAITQALGDEAAGRPLALEWLLPTEARGGVRNGYESPGQLGADRWAALIGARAVHAAASLVVTAGTATTVDVLDADGVFLGGLILPGVDLMRRSLAGNTAQLPFAEGRYVDFPRNTADAIVSGCLQAQAGAVERMFRRIADAPGAVCLLNGGAAHHFATLLDVPVREVDNLVLRGLATVAAT